MRRISRGGFTLVEVIVVVVLIALLSAAAALMVRAPLEQSNWDYSMAQLKAMDQTARLRGRSHGAIELSIDRRNGIAKLTDLRGRRVFPGFVLPSGLSFKEIASRDHAGRSTGGPKSDAVVLIRYDRYGVSPSFALQIGGKRPNRPWLVVAGMTGQYHFESQRSAVYELINQERIDAN